MLTELSRKFRRESVARQRYGGGSQGEGGGWDKINSPAESVIGSLSAFLGTLRDHRSPVSVVIAVSPIRISRLAEFQNRAAYCHRGASFFGAHRLPRVSDPLIFADSGMEERTRLVYRWW